MNIKGELQKEYWNANDYYPEYQMSFVKRG